MNELDQTTRTFLAQFISDEYRPSPDPESILLTEDIIEHYNQGRDVAIVIRPKILNTFLLSAGWRGERVGVTDQYLWFVNRVL